MRTVCRSVPSENRESFDKNQVHIWLRRLARQIRGYLLLAIQTENHKIIADKISFQKDCGWKATKFSTLYASVQRIRTWSVLPPSQSHIVLSNVQEKLYHRERFIAVQLVQQKNEHPRKSAFKPKPKPKPKTKPIIVS